MVGGVEFPVLRGEVLVVEMEPVVLRQVPLHDFLVPQLGVGDVGVLERERHRVVPRRRVGRNVDGDLGSLLERHHFHVLVGDLRLDRGFLASAHAFERDAADVGVALGGFAVLQQERAASIVEEPFGPLALEQHRIGQPVRLEVIGLVLVHRNQELGLGALRRARAQAEPQQESDRRDLDDLGPGTTLLRVIGARGSIRTDAAHRHAPHPTGSQQRERRRDQREQHDRQGDQESERNSHAPHRPSESRQRASMIHRSSQKRPSRRSVSRRRRTSGAFHAFG